MIIWFLAIVILTILISKSWINSQKENILKHLYSEEIVSDGEKKTIVKFKCPSCGNKELNYQIVSTPSVAHNTTKNLTTVYSSASKYVICPKCGTSFLASTHPNTISIILFSFVISVVIASVGLIIIAII
mgnify:CR=1 FL=1